MDKKQLTRKIKRISHISLIAMVVYVVLNIIGFFPEKLSRFENISSEFDESGALAEIVKVYKVSNCTLYHDINKEELLITL